MERPFRARWAVGLAVLLAAGCAFTGASALRDDSLPDKLCRWPVPPDEWRSLAVVPTAFGADILTDRAKHPLEVLSVSVPAGSNVRVAHAVLLPESPQDNGNTGEGSRWPPSSHMVSSRLWKQRVALPGLVPPIPAGWTYELVVGVLPLGGSGGEAAHLSVTYKNQGRTRTLAGHVGLAVSRNTKACGP